MSGELSMITVDFETTGLLTPSLDWSDQPGICQIGITLLDKQGIEYANRTILVNPERVFDDGAVKVHGITPEKVADAPNLVEVMPDLINMFRKATTWVGYNIPFDKGVLWHQLIRYGLQTKFPWPHLELDVMEVAKVYFARGGKQDIKPLKLSELHKEFFGEEHAGQHDAISDVRATNRCLKHLMKEGVI